MNTTTTVQQGIAEIEAILSAATPERWDWAKFDGDSLSAMQATIGESLAYTPEAVTLWGIVSSDAEGNERVIAYTGNGPTSEANARLVAHAPKIIRWLLAQLREEQ